MTQKISVFMSMTRYLTQILLLLLALNLLIACEFASARPICGSSPAVSHRDVTSSVPCRKENSPLLAFVAEIQVPGFQSFVAAEGFKEGQPARQLQITWTGSNFRKHFLDKIERNGTARTLDVYRLKRFAHDTAIIDDIGNSVEVMLHDVWVLLTRQSHGEKGPLRTDARPNVFYVRDSGETLWAVDAVWSGAGWEVGASKLDDPRLWDRGINIIFH